MKSTFYPAVLGFAAVLTILTACSEGDPQTTGQALPAPSRSTESAGDRTPVAQEEDGVKTPQQAEKSEFAALDTNSDGKLEESEWDSPEARTLSNLKNVSFAQLDQNSSGGIELDEFHSARTDSDDTSGTATGSTTPADALDTGESDAGGLEPTGR